MKVAIFTEGSSTKGESTDSYSNYFGGSFRSVNTVIDDLSPYCDIEVHILSEDHGYVRGDDKVKSNVSPNNKKETDYFVENLSSNLYNFDVVILLFTADVFKKVITSNWTRIVENAKQGSIWCIGTSKSALNSIDLEKLEQNHPVLVYQRKGVARIATETREELIEMVRTRSDE